MAQIIERLRKNGKKTFLVRIRMKGHPEAAASFECLTDVRIWAILRVTDNKRSICDFANFLFHLLRRKK